MLLDVSALQVESCLQLPCHTPERASQGAQDSRGGIEQDDGPQGVLAQSDWVSTGQELQVAQQGMLTNSV
jgi:hypothetical protein